MFPERHRRCRASWTPASPGVAGGVRGFAGTGSATPVTRDPQAVPRTRAPEFPCLGRAVDTLRRMTLMLMAACVLAGSTAIAADDGHPAQHLVEQVVSRVIEELESQGESIKGDPGRLYDLVNRLVLPHFDFERMSRRVLGKRWKKATPAQQERFTSAFQTLLVRTYALVLSEYRGQTITYLDPVARKRDDEIIIPVQISLSNNQSVIVAYAMQGSGSDWKVFDVAVDGVSLVTNYRASFRSEVARHGIDGLTARIEAKNSAKN